MKRQSITRLAAKQAARTSINRAISGYIQNPFLAALLKTVASQAIKKTDKLQYNSDFGTISPN